MGADGAFAIGFAPGDAWSIAQAVGFGTSFYLTEKMMAQEPTQALPITAMQCATVALLSAIWATIDGLGGLGSNPWLLDEATRGTNTMPALLLEPSMRHIAYAAAWTGLVTTAANRLGETTALGNAVLCRTRLCGAVRC